MAVLFRQQALQWRRTTTTIASPSKLPDWKLRRVCLLFWDLLRISQPGGQLPGSYKTPLGFQHSFPSLSHCQLRFNQSTRRHQPQPQFSKRTWTLDQILNDHHFSRNPITDFIVTFTSSGKSLFTLSQTREREIPQHSRPQCQRNHNQIQWPCVVPSQAPARILVGPWCIGTPGFRRLRRPSSWAMLPTLRQ